MQKTGVWHSQSQHLHRVRFQNWQVCKESFVEMCFTCLCRVKAKQHFQPVGKQACRCLTTPERLLCTSKMNRALGCRNRLLKIDFRSYLICYRNMSEMLQMLILNKWLFPVPGMKHWLQPASRTKYKMQNQGSHFLTHISALENYN